MEWRNEEFDLGGVNHLALVCSDMKRTVEFYTQVLGMRLIKTLDLPNGQGQHFFFDMGGGNALAFFWFPDAPDGVPGVSAPEKEPGAGVLPVTVMVNEAAVAVPPLLLTTCLITVNRGATSVLVIVQVLSSPATRVPVQSAEAEVCV